MSVDTELLGKLLYRNRSQHRGGRAFQQIIAVKLTTTKQQRSASPLPATLLAPAPAPRSVGQIPRSGTRPCRHRLPAQLSCSRNGERYYSEEATPPTHRSRRSSRIYVYPCPSQLNRMLRRAAETALPATLTRLAGCLPHTKALSSLHRAEVPSFKIFRFVLIKLLGAAALHQAIGDQCRRIFLSTCGDFAAALFMPFNLICASMASRLAELSKRALAAIITVYQAVYMCTTWSTCPAASVRSQGKQKKKSRDGKQPAGATPKQWSEQDIPVNIEGDDPFRSFPILSDPFLAWRRAIQRTAG